ncbi:hypothetical protein Q7P37_002003 [Cladosporium fusiforme]
MDRLSSVNKHSHSTMSASHRSDAQPSLFDHHSSRAPPDEHYSNYEHPTQRRRIEPPNTLRTHFPGDGLDFRRPVMSAAGRTGSSGPAANYGREEPIDLTDETLDQTVGNTRLPHTTAGLHTTSDAGGAESGMSSRPQRLPRFERDIIDLADSEDEEHTQPQLPPDHNTFGYSVAHDEDSLFIPETHTATRPTTAGLRRPGSTARQPSAAMENNDVEIMGSRPLSRVSSRRPTPARGSSRTPNPLDIGIATTIDLTADDDDDDVIHTNTRALPSVNGDRPAMAGSGVGTRDPPAYGLGVARLAQRMRATRPGLPPYIFGRLGEYGHDETRARIQADTQHRLALAREHTQHLQEHMDRARENLLRDRREQQQPRPHARAIPVINMNMDYGIVGFDLGFGAAPPRPATPKYEPPEPAAKGFTRTPAEEEEVVCPNCGDELALGCGEVKQQVYVVKTCGHAYCGECATRERPASNKKGKGRALDPALPPPLKKCVVVGCEKSATKSQMIHVFMSS